MNEEIEYAEMLEIPVSTVNVVRKRRRRRKNEQTAPDNEPQKSAALKADVIARVNDRVSDTPVENLPVEQTNETPAVEEFPAQAEADFLDIPERIDTVRLYSMEEGEEGLRPYDYPLQSEEEFPKKPNALRRALGIELGVACALCATIFLTNVFMPSSGINTFFRAMNTPTEEVAARPYTDFALSAVVSERSDAKLVLSEDGVLSFTDECCVYPTADGKVREVVQTEGGLYTLKINYSDTFTGVFSNLNVVYYAVGEEVKCNVPVGYSKGEQEVQVTMYSEGTPLNCFQLTEENCLAWISTAQ